MLPTTSSDPEGFRSRPIAFWKALEPLSKAYISTSTCTAIYGFQTDIPHVVVSEGIGGGEGSMARPKQTWRRQGHTDTRLLTP